jgi:hypothetical protein
MVEKCAESDAIATLKSQLDALCSSLEAGAIKLDNLRIRQNLILQAESLIKRKAELQMKLRDLDRQVKSLETARTDVSSSTVEDSSELQRHLSIITSEVMKRKRITNDLIGFISETAGTSRRDIIDELGLEIFEPISEMSPYRGC